MKFGAGANAKLPDWVPAYPGATPVGTFSMQGGDGAGGTFSFTTKDSPDTVLTFYKNALTGAGFKITANINGMANGASGNMITAEDEATKRTFVVTVGTQGGNTTANVIYGNKK